MDDDEVHEFQAKQHSIFDEIEKGLPLFKIWLVPSKDKNMIYIVSKHYHSISDGLSLLQMFSLMQDGGDDVVRGSNCIVYPPKKKFTCGEIMSKFKAQGEFDDESNEKMKIPDKLLGNT